MLLNKRATRKYALGVAKATRFKNFTRVGQSFYDEINDRIRGIITGIIAQHPSIGVTLKGRK